MRLILAIAVCKILYFIGNLTGRGSSLPGKAALLVCPGILGRIRLPETMIAVTGSNGKTSTTEMIARALKANGISVGWNHEGANQLEGVATLLLRLASFSGSVKRGAVVFECDERYARRIFEAVKPSAIVVTNLCRDQLTRNGHHEFIQNCVGAAIEAAGEGTTLVLNADDPYVTALAGRVSTDGGLQPREHSQTARELRFFGVSKAYADSEEQRAASRGASRAAQHGSKPVIPPLSGYGVYDDGAFCPVCKDRMNYDYRVAAHMGAYRCGACGHERPAPDIEASGPDPETGDVTLVFSCSGALCGGASSGGASAGGAATGGAATGAIKTRLAFPSLTGVYNLAAATAAATTAGVSAEDAARALSGYELKGGRALALIVGASEGTLLISKHENSLSYNQSLAWVVGSRRPCAVVIMVDSISRKYYTSETSWLWDVNFDILADEAVQSVVLTGRYVNELAARFAMSAVDPGKIVCAADPAGLRAEIINGGAGCFYALTCFSDKAKLLKALM